MAEYFISAGAVFDLFLFHAVCGTIGTGLFGGSVHGEYGES